MPPALTSIDAEERRWPDVAITGIGRVLERDLVLLSGDGRQRLAQAPGREAIEIDRLIAVCRVPDVGLGQVHRAAGHGPAGQRGERAWVLIRLRAREGDDRILEAAVHDALQADLQVALEERVRVAVAAGDDEAELVADLEGQARRARIVEAVGRRRAAADRALLGGEEQVGVLNVAAAALDVRAEVDRDAGPRMEAVQPPGQRDLAGDRRRRGEAPGLGRHTRSVAISVVGAGDVAGQQVVVRELGDAAGAVVRDRVRRRRRGGDRPRGRAGRRASRSAGPAARTLPGRWSRASWAHRAAITSSVAPRRRVVPRGGGRMDERAESAQRPPEPQVRSGTRGGTSRARTGVVGHMTGPREPDARLHPGTRQVLKAIADRPGAPATESTRCRYIGRGCRDVDRWCRGAPRTPCPPAPGPPRVTSRGPARSPDRLPRSRSPRARRRTCAPAPPRGPAAAASRPAPGVPLPRRAA